MAEANYQNVLENKNYTENIELQSFETYAEINEKPNHKTEPDYESIDLNLPLPPEDLNEVDRFELDEIEVLLIQALVLLCTILALLLFFFVIYNVLDDHETSKQFYRKFPIFRKNYTSGYNITKTF